MASALSWARKSAHAHSIEYIHLKCLLIFYTNFVALREMSGSHGAEYEGDCLVGFCAVQIGRRLQMLLRCLLPMSSW
jgi:hypothetical protein